jgi:hypothetical protein
VAPENIQQGHGPLGASYPDVAYGMEGDSPSFIYLVANGLGDPEHPDYVVGAAGTNFINRPLILLYPFSQKGRTGRLMKLKNKGILDEYRRFSCICH